MGENNLNVSRQPNPRKKKSLILKKNQFYPIMPHSFRFCQHRSGVGLSPTIKSAFIAGFRCLLSAAMMIVGNALLSSSPFHHPATA
jgi:hypothetical protein